MKSWRENALCKPAATGPSRTHWKGRPSVVSRWMMLFFALPMFAQSTLRLEDLERMALAASPAIAQSAAETHAAAGLARQAGAYPNPVIGASGDHVAGGPVLRGGELGGFVEQRIVTGGKLGLSR